MYRYDPPVLIVAMKWHATKVGFADVLQQRLNLNYFNNTDYVGFASCSGMQGC
jgi:hypothetical protein